MVEPTVSTLIAAVNESQSSAGLVTAVQALIASPSPAAIPTLMAVLGYNNPGAATLAMQGLIQLGHVAVLPLLTGLDGYNYGARAYAIRALAAIAHPDALDILLQAALSDFAPSVRRAATKGLGSLDWQLLAPELRVSAQAQVVTALQQLTQESDWALRYAVVVAASLLLPQLQSPDLIAQVSELLQRLADSDADVAVRARGQWVQSLPSEPLFSVGN